MVERGVRLLEKSVFTEQHKKDFDWVAAHWGELVRQYAERWIAVWRGQVVAVGNNYSEVVERAKRGYGDECHPVVGFVADTSHVY